MRVCVYVCVYIYIYIYIFIKKNWLQADLVAGLRVETLTQI